MEPFEDRPRIVIRLNGYDPAIHHVKDIDDSKRAEHVLEVEQRGAPFAIGDMADNANLLHGWKYTGDGLPRASAPLMRGPSGVSMITSGW